ncbi:Crp/Fnr family transcriptional regulator [Reichenbachiella ulvae]|uniref:Crp/Fnr family transcriptional regulator n=1 Tax=Reichenbachiella ulvae TaxID=2980104 RepID=A0ABT3CZJ5_9BACT|nr:Crp/Fnr family transcriptional regulator [Reichenbachiella ulvae]MCV9389057.1 Crp/Fnr family transcriptional regulator [Reichenbachiella ulvae]
MRNFEGIIQEYFGQMSREELAIIRSYFKDEELKRNDFFTKSQQYCHRLSLVKSGILRVFTLSEGKEVTQWISTENYLMTEIAGFFFDQPNRWSIQALTDTSLLTITKTDYQKLCEEFPKWHEIEKRFLAKCFMMLENRVFTHLSMSAEKRYELYYEQNKALFNQVPLQYIASVLGMSAETFSRIRKKQAEGQD